MPSANISAKFIAGGGRRRFSALVEPSRVRLLACLTEYGEMSVQELSDVLELPHPALVTVTALRIRSARA